MSSDADGSASNGVKKGGMMGYFSAISSGVSSAVSGTVGLAQKGIAIMIGKDAVEVVDPEGGEGDATEEAEKGRFQKQERELYWKMMHKYIGADVTSMVTLPVIIFEPMTTLQKMAEIMEYTELLNKADMCDDPYEKLVYVAAWAVSVYYAYQRAWKPFNPILGETYEMANHNGIWFVAEQVTHHPPQSAAHGENEHFSYDITSKLRTKFLGNTLEIFPIGRTRVVLKRTGEVFDLNPAQSKVHNLIFGRTWVDNLGEMVLTNLNTSDKVVLDFQPCGWFGAGRFEVDGYVYDAAEEPHMLMTGKLNESLSWQPCDSEGEPLPKSELKEVWRVKPAPPADKFSYTHFAHKVNSFDTAPVGTLMSDSRLRPDRLFLEKGDLNRSASEKSRLEEHQRAERRERDQRGDKWAPRWFHSTGESHTTPWGELDIYELAPSYQEQRKQAEARGVVVTPDDHTKFSPWQYGDEVAAAVADGAGAPTATSEPIGLAPEGSA